MLQNFTLFQWGLLNFVMIILKWYIKLHMIENMEKRLKILTIKQMLRRLLKAFGQVKADRTSENLIN